MLRHDPLAVAFALEEDGVTQDAWQVAAWELQATMQLVVVELCARRIDLLPAAASTFVADAPITNTVRTVRKPRTFASAVTLVRDTITQLSRRRNALIRAVRTADDASRCCGAVNYAVRM